MPDEKEQTGGFFDHEPRPRSSLQDFGAYFGSGGMTMIQPLFDLDSCFGDGITIRSSLKVGAL